MTTTQAADKTTRLALKFNQDGLIPAVALDDDSGDILMLAWMNQQAFDLTLETGIAHYWSRSRGKLWKKGESSGHIQEVIEIRIDCDQDALALRVRQKGAACHTGRQSCFYRRVDDSGTLTFIDDGAPKV